MKPPRASREGKRRQVLNLHPNFHAAPTRPSKGKGKRQVAIRRAFVIGNGITTSSAIYDMAFARRPSGRRNFGSRRWIWIYLNQIADPIGRTAGWGRPTIWRLREANISQLFPKRESRD